ncbi:MAG: acetate/propionate family kinase [Steroidobacteraceae bacterium]
MNVSPASLHCLCINAGSSSLKLALYRVGAEQEKRLGAAAALEIGRPEAAVQIDGKFTRQALPDHAAALEALLAAMAPMRVDAVGHRVVHGGNHTTPERVVPEVLRRLEALSVLAPLHNPPALEGMRVAGARLPGTPQVVCFDTAFHRTLPEVARALPLPRRYREHGIRRYGFHGLSYEYVARRLGARTRGRVVIAHLGNGASLAALRDGRSIDTTMGMTPTGGVMMGTRSGDLDPGVLLYLLRKGLGTDGLEHVVDREAGLLGVSGASADMATLLTLEDPDARLAVELFAYQVRKAVGALAAALGGLDRLVFTGGIGEHAAPVRSAVCRGLEHLGVELDVAANNAGAGRISTPRSRCPVQVIPTDEDAMIARHVYELLETGHAF